MRWIKRHSLIALAPLVGILCACAPDTAQQGAWMLGLFSTPSANQLNVFAVTHFELRQDGVLVVGGLADYGRTELAATEYTWEEDGPDAIEIVLSEPRDGVIRWRITPTADCNALQLETFRETGEPYTDTLHRGEICLSEACPAGQFCNGNQTVWCDGPPPPC